MIDFRKVLDALHRRVDRTGVAIHVNPNENYTPSWPPLALPRFVEPGMTLMGCPLVLDRTVEIDAFELRTL